jgi:hypothetical protein
MLNRCKQLKRGSPPSGWLVGRVKLKERLNEVLHGSFDFVALFRKNEKERKFGSRKLKLKGYVKELKVYMSV